MRHYTREAGVRKLEQLIGTVCRKQARRIAEGKTGTLVVDRAVIQEFLGGIKVRVDTELAERTRRAGVAVGLGLDSGRWRCAVHRSQPDEGQGRL